MSQENVLYCKDSTYGSISFASTGNIRYSFWLYFILCILLLLLNYVADVVEL